MNSTMTVTKRCGDRENIDLEKIHRVITWAAKGLKNVSVSEVELRSHLQFFDGIPTEAIHETIIKAAADLISPESPDYQFLAARLAVFHLRKKAFGQFEPPALYTHVTKLVELGKYDMHILQDYSREELDVMDTYIDHWRDMDFSYAAVKQLEGKIFSSKPCDTRNLRERAVPLHFGRGLFVCPLSKRNAPEIR